MAALVSAWAALLLALVVVPRPSAGQETEVEDAAPRLWGMLEPGPHAVGLSVRDVDVPSTLPSPPRAFQHGYRLFRWYPAERAVGGEAVTLAGTYARLEEEPVTRAQVRGWLREDVGLAADAVVDLEAWLDAPLLSRADAKPLNGEFPLAFWSARHNVPLAQSVLCEYLASHGFIVAWAWPLGPTPPMPWQDHPRAELERALEQYVALLDAALDAQLAHPSVDEERVACLAWSYGGESATRLSALRVEIDGVLSLSATTLDALFGAEPPKASDLRSRLVYLQELRTQAGGVVNEWNELLLTNARPSVAVRFTTIHHNDFQLMAGALAARLGGSGHGGWSAGGEASMRGYEAIVRCAAEALPFLVGDTNVLGDGWLAELPAGAVAIETF